MMTPALNLDRRVEDVSFNERQRKMQLNKREYLVELHHTVESINAVWPFKEDIQWLEVCAYAFVFYVYCAINF